MSVRQSLLAILDQPLDLHLGIERAEESFGDRQPGDGDRVTAVHHAGKHRIGGDHSGGSDVTLVAKVLGKRGGDKGVEIEAVEREGHMLPLRSRAGRRQWRRAPAFRSAGALVHGNWGQTEPALQPIPSDRH